MSYDSLSVSLSLPDFLCPVSGQDEAPPQSPGAEQMAVWADERLFSAVMSNKNHVLHSQLPVKRPKIYDLRPRTHYYSLLPKNEQNFIARLLLYKNIYSLCKNCIIHP